jgi:hypothetical protein
MDVVRNTRRGGAWGPRLGAILALLAFAVPVLGETDASAGDACPAHLFVIARSKNANIVVYDAKLGPDGGLASSEPVAAYWLLNGDEGRREELNAVERQSAYGFEVRPDDSPGTYTMVFKAARQRRLSVRMLKGCPVATAPVRDREGILRRMFVHSKETSLRPRVEYVELFFEDITTGEPLYERYVPEK